MKNLIKTFAVVWVLSFLVGCMEEEVIEPKSLDNAVNPFEWPLAEKQQSDANLKDWWHLY
ncbi:hypothetical protein N7E81_02480 [Reichenbachiella carrageenanivorans]|uniref:Uncharacterized protein n=1 Tax=Reichenbachiella carrageenanivorans TaxID=2979869 RepID=A0ABY6D1E3_9BACT|nr:hypothetical protein [Reichenbachiella carrageenanivorans]UXX79971.1 hypothetical protein N7E81_02480 [Reichenbachiella carrageenanivorans]